MNLHLAGIHASLADFEVFGFQVSLAACAFSIEKCWGFLSRFSQQLSH